MIATIIRATRRTETARTGLDKMTKAAWIFNHQIALETSDKDSFTSLQLDQVCNPQASKKDSAKLETHSTPTVQA